MASTRRPHSTRLTNASASAKSANWNSRSSAPFRPRSIQKVSCSRRTPSVSYATKGVNRCDVFPLLVVCSARAAANGLFDRQRDQAFGDDRPGFTITLKKAGTKVKTLKPGSYTITVSGQVGGAQLRPDRPGDQEQEDHRPGLQGHQDGDGEAEARDVHLLLHAAPVVGMKGSFTVEVVPAVRRLGLLSRGPSPNCASGSSSPVTTRAAYSASAGPCLNPWPEPPPRIQLSREARARGDDEVGVGRERVLADGSALRRRIAQRREPLARGRHARSLRSRARRCARRARIERRPFGVRRHLDAGDRRGRRARRPPGRNRPRQEPAASSSPRPRSRGCPAS